MSRRTGLTRAPRGSSRPAEASVAMLALLLLALPLLATALAMGPGGLPHEAAFQASASHDISAAALDRLDRYFHGDLTVVLACPEIPVGPARSAGTPSAAPAPLRAAALAPSEAERRL